MPILTVEDDADLGPALIRSLRRHGLHSDLAATLKEGRQRLTKGEYDAVILDLGLPDGEGVELLQEIRREGDTVPVIVLTARGTVSDRIQGLAMGADDYLPKPFDMGELHARLQAIMRRRSGIAGPAVRIGNMSIDFNAREALIDGRSAGLTKREYALLELLASRANRSVSKPQVEQLLFGANGAKEGNAADVTMSRLRRRLEDAGASVEILTVRGVGYVLRAKPS